MSASAGTGQPICLKCHKCRSVRRDLHHLGLRGMKATGRKRPLSSSQHGCGGARVMMEQAEYKCLICGHVGWSRHKDMLYMLRALETA
jgi:hypothetical protein